MHSVGQILAFIKSFLDLRDCLLGCLDNQIDHVINASKPNINLFGQLRYSSQHVGCIVSEAEPGGRTADALNAPNCLVNVSGNVDGCVAAFSALAGDHELEHFEVLVDVVEGHP